MATINPNWDTAWTNTSILASAITNGSTATTAVISNDNKTGTEISVDVDYGATANEGVKVFVLRDINGTDFESSVDSPWGFMLAFAISLTRRRTFTVAGDMTSDFKIHVSNASGATVTADVKYRQMTVDQV